MKKNYLVSIGLTFIITIYFGCSSGGSDGNALVQPEVSNTTTSGDFTLSGTLLAEGSSLKFILNSIIDPTTGDPITDATADDFTIDETATTATRVHSDADVINALKMNIVARAPVSLSSFQYASSKSSIKANIWFVFDTTASMSEEITGVINSIKSFATAITAAGFDAQFALVAYGDSYATMDGISGFTFGSGPLGISPSFDSCERPVLALTGDLNPVDPITPGNGGQFLTYLGDTTACGGSDNPENGYGGVNYAYSLISGVNSSRAGAVNIFIVITDAASHTDATYSEALITDPWIPPSLTALLAKIGGSVAVNVVSPLPLSEGPGAVGEDATHPNMKSVATGTGGSFIELPIDGNVDLVTLGVETKISAASVLTWKPLITKGSEKITIKYKAPDGRIGVLVLSVTWP